MLQYSFTYDGAFRSWALWGLVTLTFDLLTLKWYRELSLTAGKAYTPNMNIVQAAIPWFVRRSAICDLKRWPFLLY